ncbi:MAG TPA: nuclear transport factor 2 family protein [bacterium]|jgi:predicted SnoaL-like aldol condensation-catalyzing enzyme
MMSKKDIAKSFLELATTENVREAYEKYVHPDFVHHNPYFKSDRESILVAQEENNGQFPDKVYETVRMVEDGDLVAIHGKVKLTPDKDWIAVIHIFRFAGDMIIESWEAAQEVPKDSPNELGMF